MENDKTLTKKICLGCSINCQYSDGIRYLSNPPKIYCTKLQKFLNQMEPCLFEKEELFSLNNSIKINMPRRSGKTLLLINLSAATGYPIIVGTEQEIIRIQAMAESLGKVIPAPCLASVAARGSIGESRYNKPILIDELGSIGGELRDIKENYFVYAYTITEGDMITLSKDLATTDFYLKGKID